MGQYIDGFILPIPRSGLAEYKHLVKAVAIIWKEYGALEYRENIADDLSLLGTRSFPELMSAKEDDVIVFGWVTFASREARDLANKQVAADPRMVDLVASSNSGFDATRMAYAGFKPLI